MITISPAIQVTSKDTSLSPFPQPPLTAGAGVRCPSGQLGGTVTLAPGAAAIPLPFPNGVTTAAIVVIVAEGITDLVVTFKGQTKTIPAGQADLYYGVTSANLSLGSTLGGAVAVLVGG